MPAGSVRRRLASVTTKIVALVGVAATAAIALAAAEWIEVERATVAAADAAVTSTLLTASQAVKFDLADLNGWQTAYALDASLTGPGAARDTEPDHGRGRR